MRIKFYLKRPDAGSETSIYALVNYEGNSLKIYTGESINPKYWNPDTNAARNTPKFPEHPEFNERLNKIRSTINRAFLDYRNKHDHASPSPATLKSLIEESLRKGGERPNFLSYFEDFVKRSFTGQRMDPRSKRPIKATVAKGYQTTLNHLKEFAKSWNRKLDFDTIDLEFHTDFVKYLSTVNVKSNGEEKIKKAPLSANTIGSNIQRIKAVLSEATEKEINTNMAFKSRYFVKQSEEADTIYLTDEELKEMIELDLTGNARIDNVRDLFLIGCYTGLRVSDFSKLKKEDIKEGFIRIIQQKTGRPVVIPVHPVLRNIITKHGGNLPKTISTEKLNAYLKELGMLMPSLNKTESRRITRGGVKVINTHQKWELLTSHAARRSFATNEYKAGTPAITIMAITGHRTEKSFLKYIRVTPDEHAQKIKSLWEKRENNLKAI